MYKQKKNLLVLNKFYESFIMFILLIFYFFESVEFKIKSLNLSPIEHHNNMIILIVHRDL